MYARRVTKIDARRFPVPIGQFVETKGWDAYIETSLNSSLSTTSFLFEYKLYLWNYIIY